MGEVLQRPLCNLFDWHTGDSEATPETSGQVTKCLDTKICDTFVLPVHALTSLALGIHRIGYAGVVVKVADRNLVSGFHGCSLDDSYTIHDIHPNGSDGGHFNNCHHTHLLPF